MQIPFPEARKYYMSLALQEAETAFFEGEIPVGCVIVHENKVLAKARNQTERLKDATAHAEMLALTSAMNKLGTKYLKNCYLFVTLEPCFMCAGAIHWAQIKGIFYGASDPKKGFSLYNFKPVKEIYGGILKEETEKLLKDFFQRLRN